VRAAIYARFSTENQAKESIAEPRRECTDKAAREGFIVVAQITDEAISGGTGHSGRIGTDWGRIGSGGPFRHPPTILRGLILNALVAIPGDDHPGFSL